MPEDQDDPALACPHCGRLFRVLRAHLNSQLQCPHCGQLSAAPNEPRESAAVTPPAAVVSPPADPDKIPEIRIQPRQTQAATREMIIPTEDGGMATIRETVSSPSPLHNLPPEERERRRMRRNFVLWIICATILIASALLLARW